MKDFKIGSRVLIFPNDGDSEFEGAVGTIVSNADLAMPRVKLDKPVMGTDEWPFTRDELDLLS